MNRSELILRFAQKRNISKAAAQRFVNAIFDEMIQALGCGEHIEFRGFGTCIVEVMTQIQVEIQRQVNIWKWSLKRVRIK